MAEPVEPWLSLVRQIIDNLADSDVEEIEVQRDRFRLRLRRQPTIRRRAIQREQPSARAGQPIPAPLTGVFYRAPSPTADPYVREGDYVESGAIVGLIETMKIFNEVKVEQSGRIEQIVAAPGRLVHAGDTLLYLLPGEQPS